VDNAIDASAAGQSVAISFAQSGQGARIEIEDSGGGIDAEILPTVLRLGFTTRAAEGGQGIGLTIASEILKSLDATLDIRSTRGQGTTVSIVLPPSAIGFANTGRTREAQAHIPSSG
jgi:signal transduction histidine kinase